LSCHPTHIFYPYHASNNKPNHIMSNKEILQENEELKRIIINIVESMSEILHYVHDVIEIDDEEVEEDCCSSCGE